MTHEALRTIISARQVRAAVAAEAARKRQLALIVVEGRCKLQPLWGGREEGPTSARYRLLGTAKRARCTTTPRSTRARACASQCWNEFREEHALTSWLTMLCCGLTIMHGLLSPTIDKARRSQGPS